MKENVITVIMAAGEGTRMKSKLPKVLHQLCKKPIIDYVVDVSFEITKVTPVVVVGHGAEQIKEHLGDKVRYAYQYERLGTGHAVMMAQPYLDGFDGYALILAGDTPLIQAETLDGMIDYAVKGNYSAVALSAIMENSDGYGRIIRDKNGDFDRIVEHKDASREERKVKEINASMYCFEVPSLLDALKKINNDNAQKEYYLTDVLEIMKREGKKVGIYAVSDADEVLGINTRVQLAEAEKILRQRINQYHMLNGVTLIDPDNTYIGPDVEIGRDTVVYPGNMLEGKTKIGEECTLYPNSRIVNAVIGNHVDIQASVLLDCQIGDYTTVGPFAYIRPGTVIGKHVRIGDFVEVKNSTIGDGTKVSHLTYVGDGTIGEKVNVGCGVVFSNYDGEKKHRTIVGNNAFIGCNVNLVAPVEVEDGAYIAAGSTITERVPADSLAIARARQVNKEDWVKKRRAREE